MIAVSRDQLSAVSQWGLVRGYGVEVAFQSYTRLCTVCIFFFILNKNIFWNYSDVKGISHKKRKNDYWDVGVEMCKKKKKTLY